MVLEITRLGIGTVREVESFVSREICSRFAGRLPGSFGLIVDMASTPDGRVSKSHVAAVIDILESSLLKRATIEGAELPTGLTIIPLDPASSLLVPLVVRPDLSLIASTGDPWIGALEEELTSIVAESAEKFTQWPHCQRCLLIDISQSGLDWEFHGLRFEGMQKSFIDYLVCRLPQTSLTAIDRILLEPGIRVWIATDVSRPVSIQIAAGTKHADRGLGIFLQAWPGPSRPI